MDPIHLVLAKNLKALRTKRKLSLDKVAEMTGVSKAMLGQIERGESSPTIQTVWKIASGLRVSFTSLVHQQQPDTVVVTRNDVRQFQSNEGKYRVYPYFPFEEGRRFEMYSVEIDPGLHVHSDPHSPETEEFLVVFEGELTVRIDGRDYPLQTSDSIRFKSDKEHEYFNTGNCLTRASVVISYPD